MFVTIEGVDGCGKSSTLRRLSKLFSEHGTRLLLTKEPAGTKLGEKIHRAVLDPHRTYTPIQQAQMFSVARRDHLARVINPALRAGKDVICDRYTLSSMAYQGDWHLDKDGWPVDERHVKELNLQMPGYRIPDLNIYLEASPAVDVKRLQKRRGKKDKYDRSLESVRSVKRLQEHYHFAIKTSFAPCLRVDANRSSWERAEYIYYSIKRLKKGLRHHG